MAILEPKVGVSVFWSRSPFLGGVKGKPQGAPFFFWEGSPKKRHTQQRHLRIALPMDLGRGSVAGEFGRCWGYSLGFAA